MSLMDEYIDAVNRGDTDAITRTGKQLDQLDTIDRRRLTNPTVTLNAALWYAGLGWPVFPLQTQGKTPATRNGFKDATIDIDQIKTWWTDNPTHNIGLPTGLNFDVIDIDGPEGIRAMYWGDHAPHDTLTVIGKVSTSRDGGQHIYVPPTGRGNAASILPSIDYRGKGGYVVAPPSTGANGRRYTWLQPPLTFDGAA